MFETKLGIQAIFNNKKRTFITLGLISLLIVVIVFANALIYTNRASKDLQLELIYGSWTHAFFEESRSSTFDAVGTYYRVSDSFGSFDKTMFELSNFEYYKGREPKSENEVIVTLNVINNLGLSYDLNQVITIDNKEYTLVGIIYPYNEDWIRINYVKYPTIITTGLVSSNKVFFGKAKKLTPFYNVSDYIGVNTYGFPYIDTNGSAFSDRTSEDIDMHVQSFKLTQLLLVASIVVLLVVFKNNVQFYKKRFDILSQLGVNNLGILFYYIPQIILFVLASWLFYNITPTILKYVFNSIDQVRFDIYNKNLVYASEMTLWMIIALNLFALISEKIWLFQTRLMKGIQVLLVMIVCFATIYLVTPLNTHLNEIELPLLQRMRIDWEHSMYYIVNGSMGGFTSEPNPFTSYMNEWEKGDLESLLNHPKTKHLIPFSVKYVSYIRSDNEMGRQAISYHDDEVLQNFNLPITLSSDFINGLSFYIHGDNTAEFAEGDVIYFNDVPFKYEGNFYFDEDSYNTLSLNTGVLISVNGAHRLSFPTDRYNIFMLRAERMSDFLDYDALVRRVAQNADVTNFRLNVERAINRQISITLFKMFEILIQYGLGVAILSLLCLQQLMMKRKTLAIQHFLGVSKVKLILKNATQFALPAIIILLPSIYVVGNQASLTSSLVFNILLGLVFVFIVWLISLVIHINYLKGSLIELLDERE